MLISITPLTHLYLGCEYTLSRVTIIIMFKQTTVQYVLSCWYKLTQTTESKVTGEPSMLISINLLTHQLLLIPAELNPVQLQYCTQAYHQHCDAHTFMYKQGYAGLQLCPNRQLSSSEQSAN